MLEEENLKFDLKKISLSLFGKAVVVHFRNDCENFSKHGPSVCGTLSGRIWGERFVSESERAETVIAIRIKLTEREEITIQHNDIISISEFKPETNNSIF